MWLILYLAIIPVGFFIFYSEFARRREEAARKARTSISGACIVGLGLKMSAKEAKEGNNSDIDINFVNWEDLKLELANSNKHACLFQSKKELLSDEN